MPILRTWTAAITSILIVSLASCALPPGPFASNVLPNYSLRPPLQDFPKLTPGQNISVLVSLYPDEFPYKPGYFNALSEKDVEEIQAAEARLRENLSDLLTRRGFVVDRKLEPLKGQLMWMWGSRVGEPAKDPSGGGPIQAAHVSAAAAARQHLSASGAALFLVSARVYRIRGIEISNGLSLLENWRENYVLGIRSNENDLQNIARTRQEIVVLDAGLKTIGIGSITTSAAANWRHERAGFVATRLTGAQWADRIVDEIDKLLPK